MEDIYQYKECNLCPRKCGVDRYNGSGLCGAYAKIKVARAALHFWEEPCISGAYEDKRRGSGAVFFAGCNLRCVFCQNREISALVKGKEISVTRLADIFLDLEARGAYNINLVTGTQYVPSIISAIEIARSRGLGLPILYNSSGYESAETLRMLEGYIDIYLPDYKYSNGELAKKYSKASDYPVIAMEAIEEMVRQVGYASYATVGEQYRTRDDLNISMENMSGNHDAAQEDDNDEEQLIMMRGVIVRHLILPGYKRNSKEALRELYERFGNDICYSIMSQYTPLPHVCESAPELNRRITKREYNEVVDYALALGIENAFIQDMDTAKESFIPDFDETGV